MIQFEFLHGVDLPGKAVNVEERLEVPVGSSGNCRINPLLVVDAVFSS